MTRLLILVEGQSEEIFVKRTLTPFLAERGVYVQPPVVLWTKRSPRGGGFRGGVSGWNQIRRNLLPLTRDTGAWVTAMLDFYGLPEDFPGCLDALEPGNPHCQAIALQERFAEEIGHSRLIPFFALHEFEAWVFSIPEAVAEHFGQVGLTPKLQQILTQTGGPELIDHGLDTHPKARLKALVTDYKETSDGPTILNKLGIPAIRDRCPHFSAWLQRLEALGQMA